MKIAREWRENCVVVRADGARLIGLLKMVRLVAVALCKYVGATPD